MASSVFMLPKATIEFRNAFRSSGFEAIKFDLEAMWPVCHTTPASTPINGDASVPQKFIVNGKSSRRMRQVRQLWFVFIWPELARWAPIKARYRKHIFILFNCRLCLYED